MKLNITFLFILLAFGFIACDEEPDPVDPCPTTNLTYTDDIAPILNGSCAVMNCHAEGAQGTFEMHNYATTEIAVGFDRIIGAINHENDFSAMPSGGDKLEDCTIDKITAWINAGAPE